MVQLLLSIDHHELTLSNIFHASRTISVAHTYICIFNHSPASRTISVARGYLFIFYLTFSCVTDNLRRTQVYNHKSNIFLKKHINDLTIITIVGYHNLIRGVYRGGGYGGSAPPWKSEGFDFQGVFSPQLGLSPPGPVKKWPISTAPLFPLLSEHPPSPGPL